MPRASPCIWLLLAVACGCSKTEPRQQPPSPKAPPVKQINKEKKPDPCAEIIEAYTVALDRAKLDCKADADCGCYSGGVGPRSGCGGVVNRATLVKLRALWQRYRDRGCRYTRNCAPWACLPRCHKGRCVRASVGRRIQRDPRRMARRMDR